MSDKQYSIFTLFGDAPDGSKQPVKLAVPVDFFEEKKWKLVVERLDRTGFVIQRDVTQQLGLFEAMDIKKDLVTVYEGEGWKSDNNFTFYSIGREDSVVFYVDVETAAIREENLIPA